MGEHAEDIINGSVCTLCGCMFQDEDGELFTHGYPVVCWGCWAELTSDEKKIYQKAQTETI